MINLSMVNLQWSAISAVLIVEIVFVVLLLLPFISPKVWHAIFNSKPVQKLLHWKYTKAGLHIGAAGLVLFFMDAVRGIYVYGQTKDVQTSAPVMSTADKDALLNMRMYRAERNFFISGFALFFGFLLRRLIGLICLEAELMAEADGTAVHTESIKREHSHSAKEALDKLTKVE